MSTTSNGWLCRCINFGGLGAAWLRTYGQEKNMSFICMEEEADYDFRLTCTLLRLRRSSSDYEILQDLILPHVNLCCSNNHFPSAWISTRCDHFRGYLDSGHRFRGRTLPLSVFVLWRCVVACFTLNRDCGQFYVPIDCPE